MIRAVVFDLDGLLVDSEPVWFNVRTTMFGRFGMTWTDEDQKALMGRSTQAWIDYVTGKLGGRLSAADVKKQTIAAMIEQYRSGGVRTMKGADTALAFCAKHFHVGLASGSPNVLITSALEAKGWSRYFQYARSSDEVRAGKPEPDVYFDVFSALGVEPASSAVVEDSGSGILAGKAAGAIVVAVPNPALAPPSTILERADLVLDSLEELGERLQALSDTTFTGRR